jgi:hypothetical protein
MAPRGPEVNVTKTALDAGRGRETFPDPREDDSFKRFLQDAKFQQALREMGYPAR